MVGGEINRINRDLITVRVFMITTSYLSNLVTDGLSAVKDAASLVWAPVSDKGIIKYIVHRIKWHLYVPLGKGLFISTSSTLSRISPCGLHVMILSPCVS